MLDYDPEEAQHGGENIARIYIVDGQRCCPHSQHQQPRRLIEKLTTPNSAHVAWYIFI